MNDKKVITWKDADQNLCTVAASILHSSMQRLRSSQLRTAPHDVDGAEPIAPGYAQAAGSQRTWWSGDPANAYPESFIDLLPNDRYGPSSQCWYCFQNMVRQRLQQARQEIEDNRYLRKNEPKTSDQRSRNETKRPTKGKFGRKPERE